MAVLHNRRRPARAFLDERTDVDAAAVVAAMQEAAIVGLGAGRHLRCDIYGLRVDSGKQAYRLLFAAEGRQSQGAAGPGDIAKKTQKTPAAKIDLASRRLADWRARASRQ